MKQRVIQCTLDSASIGKAIQEIQKYKQDTQEKTVRLRQRVAEEIGKLAETGFAGAIVDDLLGQDGGPRTANVKVEIQNDGSISTVIASGTDAVWAEFGAGVYHNGSAGSSPHPKGSELGFTIGGYGEKGKRNTWGFIEDGELRLTHGAPASMPLYNAMQEVCKRIAEIAQEVWASD